MFSGVLRLIGLVSVRETETHIIIDGLNGTFLMDDIQKTWNTSRLNTYMFTEVAKHRVSFPKFFAIDIEHILVNLLKEVKTKTPRRALNKILIELRSRTWLADVDKEEKHTLLDFSKVKEIGFPLLDHQLDFLKMYNRIVPSYRLGGMLLAATPGSGKTITGLALGSCLGADVIIIISPKNAIDRVWGATIANNLTDKPEYWLSTNPGEAAPVGLRYYVFHYEALNRAIELMAKLNPKRVLIDLDESHNFNEITSQRTQMFLELIAQSRKKAETHVVLASGTPIKALGAEAVPLLRAIDPFFNPDAEQRFKKIFGKDAKKANDILCNRIGLVSFKVVRSVVITNKVTTIQKNIQIPNWRPYTLDAIRIDMAKFIEERHKFYKAGMAEYEKEYELCLSIHEKTLRTTDDFKGFELYKQHVDTIRKFYDPRQHKDEVMYCNRYELGKISPTLPQEKRKPFRSIRSIIKYVHLKIMGEALGSILGKRRAACHVAMVPYMGLPDIIDGALKKTVIFTSYVEVVKAMEPYLKEEGYRPIAVYGETNKDLAAMIAKFDKDPDANPIIATYPSLSTAVPLVMANTEVLSNMPWRDNEREQAVARVDRIGQDSEVFIYELFLDTGSYGNVSTRSKDIMEWSRAQVAAIMGIDAPMDLVESLEAMRDSQVPLDESALAFMDEIKRAFPLETAEL